MNKFDFITCQLVFLHFLEESEDTKKTFQNQLTFRNESVKHFNFYSDHKWTLVGSVIVNVKIALSKTML